MAIEKIVGIIIAAALVGYLFAARTNPDKF
ncbi:K(+)-transporting ATPase subunit F [Streptomyces sp. NPDC021093]